MLVYATGDYCASLITRDGTELFPHQLIRLVTVLNYQPKCCHNYQPNVHSMFYASDIVTQQEIKQLNRKVTCMVFE